MMRSTKIQKVTDKAAIVISFLCLVHCVAQPLLFLILPVLPGLYLLEHQLFHQVILFAVVPLGLVALVIGYLNHKRFGVLCTGIVGLILLICISLFGHDLLSETVEIVLTELASLIIICAHVMNYQLRPTKICNSQEQIATKP